MYKLVFELSNGGKIKMTKHLLKTIEPFVQKESHLNEAGGVLLGRFIKNSKDIIIDKVTVPMKGDKQTRCTFKRLSTLHQIVVEEEWSLSKGTCNYLGEWHTHPETDPEPSGVDIRDWKRKLKTDLFSSRYLYFIIAGTEKLSLWEGDRRTLEIKKLKIIV